MYDLLCIFLLCCFVFHGVVLSTVCVQMRTVQVTPGFNPISVSKIYLYLARPITGVY